MSAMLTQPRIEKADVRRAKMLRARSARAGFSMVEILFAILIIGILLSLLIVGVRKGTANVRDTADRQAVRTIAVAVSKFKDEFGFEPPLVKEDSANPSGVFIDNSAGRNIIEIYDVGRQVDLDILTHKNFTFSTADPLRDERFSIRTLPIYLAGALEVRYSGAVNVPIDGVKGPGFYAPKRDGSFDLPLELRSAASGAVKKSLRGKVYEPFINLGGSAIKLVQDPSNARRLTLADRNGVPIRYYKWLPSAPGSSGTPDMLKDLQVPTMVGRKPAGFPIRTPAERDLTQNPALRGASFAIVAAGTNKFFGDEPLNDIRAGMGLSPALPDEQVRQAAEEDNIVEVGK